MGVFFAVAGIVNICIVMAKSECYVGVKEPHNKRLLKNKKIYKQAFKNETEK